MDPSPEAISGEVSHRNAAAGPRSSTLRAELALKRGSFRPMLSRAGQNLFGGRSLDVPYQRAPSFRFHHQAGSATRGRGALFNPDYNLEEAGFSARGHCACGRSVCRGMSAANVSDLCAGGLGPRQRSADAGKSDRVSSRHPVDARAGSNSTNAASGLSQVRLVARGCGATMARLMIEPTGRHLGASHVVNGRGRPRRRQSRVAVPAAAAHSSMRPRA